MTEWSLPYLVLFLVPGPERLKEWSAEKASFAYSFEVLTYSPIDGYWDPTIVSGVMEGSNTDVCRTRRG